MLIEELYYEDDVLFVGFAEIENVNTLSKDDLISLASKVPEHVLAIQFLDSSLISGLGHLLSASQNALNAWKGNYALSRTLSVEILVYASAQRQISKALDIIGISEKSRTLALVVLGDNQEKVRYATDDIISQVGHETKQMFEQNQERFERVSRAFSISMVEIQTISNSDQLDDLFDALTRCVMNKVSLVALDN